MGMDLITFTFTITKMSQAILSISTSMVLTIDPLKMDMRIVFTSIPIICYLSHQKSQNLIQKSSKWQLSVQMINISTLKFASNVRVTLFQSQSKINHAYYVKMWTFDNIKKDLYLNLYVTLNAEKNFLGQTAKNVMCIWVHLDTKALIGTFKMAQCASLLKMKKTVSKFEIVSIARCQAAHGKTSFVSHSLTKLRLGTKIFNFA